MDLRRSLKEALKAGGYELCRARPRRADFLGSRLVDTVLDVGANVGQFGRTLRREGFRGRIVSFEPTAECFAALRDVMEADGNWTGFNVGLSGRDGTATINVGADTAFSSLHPVRPAALRFDPLSAPVRTEEIRLARLDGFDATIAGDRLFLKVDTQGHERAVLEGAGALLDRVAGVQLELPVSALYDGVWTLEEALGFMRGLGFVPALFTPVNAHKDDPLAVLEFDCVFRRLDPFLD